MKYLYIKTQFSVSNNILLLFSLKNQQLTSNQQINFQIMKFAVTFVIIAAAYMLLLGASAQNAQTADVYCGRHLANTMAYWCPMIYEEKRSGNVLSRYSNDGFFGRQVRNMDVQKRGIVDECCFQPCTLEVLLSYC